MISCAAYCMASGKRLSRICRRHTRTTLGDTRGAIVKSTARHRNNGAAEVERGHVAGDLCVHSYRAQSESSVRM